MPRIIDGKALAHKKTEDLKVLLAKKVGQHQPRIVSFANYEDPAVEKFTQIKSQKAAELGILYVVDYLNHESHFNQVLEMIRNESLDPINDGVMLQLPLPSNLKSRTEELTKAIQPEKDVDGLSEAGQKFFQPATVKGVLSLLEAEVPEWKNKKLAVVGALGQVGQALVKALEKQKLDLIKIDQDLGDITQDLKSAEIIFSATGVHNLIQAEYVSEGFIGIDIGLGDFNSAALEKSSAYTPKTGGVGPMTVISLMENVVESFSRRTH